MKYIYMHICIHIYKYFIIVFLIYNFVYTQWYLRNHCNNTTHLQKPHTSNTQSNTLKVQDIHILYIFIYRLTRSVIMHLCPTRKNRHHPPPHSTQLTASILFCHCTIQTDSSPKALLLICSCDKIQLHRVICSVWSDTARPDWAMRRVSRSGRSSSRSPALGVQSTLLLRIQFATYK